MPAETGPPSEPRPSHSEGQSAGSVSLPFITAVSPSSASAPLAVLGGGTSAAAAAARHTTADANAATVLITPDRVRAVNLYRRAAAAGHEGARVCLERLAPRAQYVEPPSR